MTPLSIDREAFRADFEALSKITDPAHPWTRRSFTPRFQEGRAWLRSQFEHAGLTVRLDAAGNMIGRWEAEDPTASVLMIGSHIDTVPSGGRFDGIAGVLSGLAALRALKAAGYQPNHTLELVDFLAEEPSAWGLSCVGSRGMVGALGSKELALKGPNGETLADAIDRIGGSVETIDSALRTDVAGFLELHIEQGPVLEAKELAIGVVTGIAGIARVKVRFVGTAAHAGTAPMDMRADAGLALARFALTLRSAALAMTGDKHFTATIGLQHLEPGGANVVPGAAEALIDIRAEDDLAMARFVESLPQLAAQAAEAEACQIAEFLEVSRTHAVSCDSHLRSIIGNAARSVNQGTLAMASGAGHDAAFLARIAPSAMIFVPSRDGRSHCPEEWTDPDTLALGADVLLNTLFLRDRSNSGSVREHKS